MYEQVLEVVYKIRLFQNLFFIGSVYLAIMFFTRRKRVFATLTFFAGFLWFVYVPSIAYIIGNLGMDSLDEAKNFDNSEALFWISTVIHSIKPLPDTPLLFILYLFISVATYYLFSYILKRLAFEKNRYIIQSTIAVVLILCSLAVVFRESVWLFIRNTNELEMTKKNFDNQIPELHRSEENIDVVVFIGESLSVFDMGVYGYPRKTTPNLSRMARENRNLLVFHNVFSTHTHTSQSLLEALSFPVDRSDNFLPVTQRKRISLVDVLSKDSIRTRLISNQGMTGTWNEASAIIFKKAEKTFGVNSSVLGNNEGIVKKPWDHIFFMRYLALDQNHEVAAPPVVTFLHSYAGHGPYLESIPENFRSPVDKYFTVNASKRISESDIDVKDQIEGYDSALRYIDYMVSNFMSYINRQKKPTVFIMFSDHGESVYTGRGHDSSRFIHEMARIPFIIYFNDAAIAKYPDVYNRYRHLSETRETATLAQLSSVIADISGVRFNNSSDAAKYLTPLIGEQCIHTPIVVREVKSGLTYINLNKKKPVFPAKSGYRMTDATDPATVEFVRSRGLNIKPDKDNDGTVSLERKRRNQLVHGQ
jgi:glucan phosphoethanolaminetransferase (alkaline phosphatase superfamily)